MGRVAVIGHFGIGLYKEKSKMSLYEKIVNDEEKKALVG